MIQLTPLGWRLVIAVTVLAVIGLTLLALGDLSTDAIRAPLSSI